MTTFSVIIPVYNVAPYLRECLDSIAAQTFANWECICVDDGSTDGSGTILDEYAEKDGRFKIVHQKNAGVSAARNTALEKATGEFFFFVDGDDAIVPDSMECFNRVFNQTGGDGILCHPDENFLKFGDEDTKANGICVLSANEPARNLLFGRYASRGYVPSRIYRKEVFGHLRFALGVNVTEDGRFWVDALCINAVWTIVEKKYYVYRNRVDSATHSHQWALYRDCFNTFIYTYRKMKCEMKCTPAELRRYTAKFRLGQHLTYKWACRFYDEWPRNTKDEFRKLVSRVCEAASPEFPFSPIDRFRILGMTCGCFWGVNAVAEFFERIAGKTAMLKKHAHRGCTNLVGFIRKSVPLNRSCGVQ